MAKQRPSVKRLRKRRLKNKNEVIKFWVAAFPSKTKVHILPPLKAPVQAVAIKPVIMADYYLDVFFNFNNDGILCFCNAPTDPEHKAGVETIWKKYPWLKRRKDESSG